MQYYVLFYHLIDDYVSRRAVYRADHLGKAEAAHERGELVYGGAFSDPADQALLVFRVADKAIIEQFVREDPYVVNGLVTRWEIRPWTVVIGNE